ncbi:hypothetical protein [Desertihabitans aurantiacus]|uniref:hypothetical protein n=1 Tax=Desertihabitans aurantiacus TaxID=2282477 RepID=UPI0018E50267|nr:hypothetical protein [Desertihabitans aurantiacus]
MTTRPTSPSASAAPSGPSTASAVAAPDPHRRQHRLGLPVAAVAGLALLGAPRVVLHDLDVLHEGTALNAVFVFAPPLVWVLVVLLTRVATPFRALLAVGAGYGVLLAVIHQLLWARAFAGAPPQLGGTLADLDPAAQEALLRGTAVVSSLVTGLVVGALTGLVALALTALLRRARR